MGVAREEGHARIRAGDPAGTRRNIYSALAAQWSSALISIVASVLVARMMLPAELGVFTVTMSIIAVLGTIQNSGAQEYLLYTAEIDTGTRRAALGLSMVSTGALVIVLLAVSPLAARFYHHQGVRDVLLVIALQTGLGVLSAPIAAMLAREQRFDLIGLIAFCASVTLSLAQILFTWAGWSYMGLAWAMTLSTSLSVVLHLVLARHHALFRPSFHDFRKVMGFGSKLFGTEVMNQVNNSVPQILLGHLSGLAVAGLFGRANTVTQIYSQTIARAVDPVIHARLAAEGRAGGDPIGQVLQSSRALLAISAPFFGFIALDAHLFVPVLFGAQWTAAVPATRILCCGFFVWPLTSPIAALLLTTLRPGLLLRIRTLNALLRIALVIAFAPLGLGWVAAGVTASIYLNLGQCLLAIRAAVGVSIPAYLAGLAKSLLITFVALLGAAAALWLTAPIASGWARLLIGAGATGLVWLAMLAVTRHLLWIELVYALGRIARVRPLRTSHEHG